MRVLHVAAGNLFGGVERILVEIARAAPPAQHEYALFFEGTLSAALDAARARRHPLGEARFRNPVSIWRARQRLKRLARSTQFDAIVCHSPWAYAIAAPALSSQPVLWAHDALRGKHWTERRVARRSPALVICNSRYTERSVAQWLTASTRIVVHAPVAEPGPHASRDEVRRSLGASATAAAIVLASRFERWKGHAQLLHAVSGLEGEWELWIAGAAQRSHELAYERELKRLASALRVDSRVRFLGHRQDLPAVLAAADLHCQPNTAPEPFGLVFVEALYAGVPVVTADAGGAREIVTPECGVLLPLGDTPALREALQGLISDRARRARLGAAGPARARLLCDPIRQISLLESALTARAAIAS
jgi:glycosyltransferase involved in cell wall biosynthesis